MNLPSLLLGLLLVGADPQPVAISPDRLPVLIVSDTGYVLLVTDEKGKHTVFGFSQVLVIGKPTNPPVGPVAPPTDPVVPEEEEESEFGLTPSVKRWLELVPAEALKEKVWVRAAIEKISKRIKNADFENIREMELALGTEMLALIADGRQWAKFGVALNAALATLQSEAVGKIKTLADYDRALTEILKGLQ